jgi:hypothetical protein
LHQPRVQLIQDTVLPIRDSLPGDLEFNRELCCRFLLLADAEEFFDK